MRRLRRSRWRPRDRRRGEHRASGVELAGAAVLGDTYDERGGPGRYGGSRWAWHDWRLTRRRKRKCVQRRQRRHRFYRRRGWWWCRGRVDRHPLPGHRSDCGRGDFYHASWRRHAGHRGRSREERWDSRRERDHPERELPVDVSLVPPSRDNFERMDATARRDRRWEVQADERQPSRSRAAGRDEL